MTSNELRQKFNSLQLGELNPPTYKVSHETYANVCQDLFDHIERDGLIAHVQRITISLGPHNGILFKNVELILTKT